MAEMRFQRSEEGKTDQTSLDHQPSVREGPRLSEVVNLLGPLASLPELQSPPGEQKHTTSAPWSSHTETTEQALQDINETVEYLEGLSSSVEGAPADLRHRKGLVSNAPWPAGQVHPSQSLLHHHLPPPHSSSKPSIAQPGQRTSWQPWDFVWEPFLLPQKCTPAEPPGKELLPFATAPSSQPRPLHQILVDTDHSTSSQGPTFSHRPQPSQRPAFQHMPWHNPQGFPYYGLLPSGAVPIFSLAQRPAAPLLAWALPPYFLANQPPYVHLGQPLDNEPPLTQAARVHRRIQRPGPWYRSDRGRGCVRGPRRGGIAYDSEQAALAALFPTVPDAPDIERVESLCHVANAQGSPIVHLPHRAVKQMVHHQISSGKPSRAPWYRSISPAKSKGRARSEEEESEQENAHTHAGEEMNTQLKTASSGTGVFLPTGQIPQYDMQHKKACSSTGVFLPTTQIERHKRQ